MAKTFEKTRKAIAKKKGGNVTALHENSRNSQRLKRALIRDDKLAKLASNRRKTEQPLIQRVMFMRDAVVHQGSQPLEQGKMSELINDFVHQHLEEFESLKKARRPGRPASAREDLLKMKIDADEKEFESGFYLPDLTSAENVELLEKWEGSWPYLASLKWIRMKKSGETRPSTFPPKGSS